MDTGIDRRQALLAAGLTAASYDRILGANDRVRAGYVGLGNRGHNALLPASMDLRIDIAAVCDVFAPQIDRALTLIHKESGAKPASYTDYHDVFERDDIDVVFLAVPEHWHAKMTIEACEAGKDVYVEKPLAHTVEECLAIVEAVKRTGRVVQVGLQQRSMKIYRDALAQVKQGVIGNVDRCEMAWGSGGGSARPAGPVSDPPDGLDWEAWQGPAPHHPYRESRHRGWHGWWDYGHGQITDLGVHVMDVARWFMGIGAPLSCYAAGYHTAGYDVKERVPNVVEALWKADRALVTYSNRLNDMLNRFWGTGGWISVNREYIHTAVIEDRRKPPVITEAEVIEPGYEKTKLRKFVVDTAVHIRNFLDCVRTREEPSANVEESAQSTIACLLAGRAVRTGRPYTWDGRRVVDES